METQANVPQLRQDISRPRPTEDLDVVIPQATDSHLPAAYEAPLELWVTAQLSVFLFLLHGSLNPGARFWQAYQPFVSGLGHLFSYPRIPTGVNGDLDEAGRPAG